MCEVLIQYYTRPFWCYLMTNLTSMPLCPLGCLQVNVAFNVVYESGLNEYALYMNCEGRRASHRGYERAMSHLFTNYRKQPQTQKVSVCDQVLLAHNPVLQILLIGP